MLTLCRESNEFILSYSSCNMEVQESFEYLLGLFFWMEVMNMSGNVIDTLHVCKVPCKYGCRYRIDNKQVRMLQTHMLI